MMSQAEELLNTLEEIEEEAEKEEHIIIDKDRFWTVPETLKRIAVQNDKDVETVTFDCCRYWDENDLSQLILEVVFMRKDKKVGCTPCKNISIDENDDTIIHFDWTVEGESTEVEGELWTLLRASSTDENGNLVKDWNSELCKEMKVSAGLKCHDQIESNYPDVITYMLESISRLSEEISDLKENGTGTGLALENVTDGEVMTSVEEIILATGITLDKTALSFNELESQTLVATVEPSNTTDKVVWTSSNGNVATVENGVVTPVASGSCTITATVGSFSARCSVTVDIEVIVTYTITRNLTGCVSNSSVTTINGGSALTETFTASNNYTLDGATVSVTMGDTDISSSYVNGVLTVASITGDIVITVSAVYNAVVGSGVKASIETIDGTDYLVVNDTEKLFEINPLNANSYSNDTYQMYTSEFKFKAIINMASESIFNGVIKQSTANGQNGVLGDTQEGDLYLCLNGTLLLRLPKDLNGYETVQEYMHNTYEELKFALVEGYGEKVIDPTLITSMTEKTSNNGFQYAQFGYSDLPSSNIYSGSNSLFVYTFSNANQSGTTFPSASMSTTTLSISFEAGTFEEFTLENVKQYLTDNPLIFWYKVA